MAAFNPIAGATAAIAEMGQATMANMMMQRAGTMFNAIQSQETQKASISNEANKQGTAAVTGVAGSATDAVKSAFSK